MIKKEKIGIIIVFVVVLGALTLALYKNNEYIKLTKEDLIYVQEQFDYLEEIKKSKSANKIIIHTKTNEEYGFEAKITINEDLFNSIKEIGKTYDKRPNEAVLNEEYILAEKKAPDGYIKSQNITFKVTKVCSKAS